MKKLGNRDHWRGWWVHIDMGSWAVGLHNSRDELTFYFPCVILAFMKR